jgi:hypothetical protein
MKTVWTYNEFHIGDNMVFMHLLRPIAKSRPSDSFVHFCHGNVSGIMRDMSSDIGNILIETFDSRSMWDNVKDVAINTWKNADDFWVKSKHRWDWSAFTLSHHAHISRKLGSRTPFTIKEHLLFDFPLPTYELKPYDYFIVNSEPCSGQFKCMAQHGSGYLTPLILELAEKGSVITTEKIEGIDCTRDTEMTIADIGSLSINCRNHIMVATGPMWPTINTTNNHDRNNRLRIVLLDNGEMLNLPEILQAGTVEEIKQEL